MNAGSVCARVESTEPLLAAIAQRIGPQKFNAWFKHGTTVSLDGGHVKVGAANPFIAGWIESHFAGELVASAEEVTGRKLELMVGIDPVLGRQLQKRQLDTQARLVSRGTAGATRRPPKPAPLRHRLEDFVVGSCNQLAFSAVSAVAGRGRADFNPLFIHGACGVGKTHLLQGVCNALNDLAEKTPLTWKYLSAEQFTNEFIEALRQRKLDAFRRTYRRLDVLVIDDVHFLAAKKATQEEFLHTFNTIEAAGKQVVMASDAHPRMLGQLTEQLVSRFLSGMVVKIDPPDRATRMTILQRAAGRINLSADRSVLEYLATHVRGSVRELEGALVKLTAMAAVSKRPATSELARESLADHLAQTGSAVTLGDIETTTAAFFGVTPADMHSTRRTHTVSLARSLAMFLARRHTRMSFPEIGRAMGKNHSSAVLAFQRVEQMLATDAPCDWMTPAGSKTASSRALIELLTEQLP